MKIIQKVLFYYFYIVIDNYIFLSNKSKVFAIIYLVLWILDIVPTLIFWTEKLIFS